MVGTDAMHFANYIVLGLLIVCMLSAAVMVLHKVCPAPSFTTKQASNSSTDHGGGKRRGAKTTLRFLTKIKVPN